MENSCNIVGLRELPIHFDIIEMNTNQILFLFFIFR